MSHAYAQNVIHLVFSTKDRRKLTTGEFRPRMWAYAAGICKKLDILVLAVGGVEDHIHFPIRLHNCLFAPVPSFANTEPLRSSKLTISVTMRINW